MPPFSPIARKLKAAALPSSLNDLTSTDWNRDLRAAFGCSAKAA